MSFVFGSHCREALAWRTSSEEVKLLVILIQHFRYFRRLQHPNIFLPNCNVFMVGLIRFHRQRVDINCSDDAESSFLQADGQPPTSGEKIYGNWFLHSYSDCNILLGYISSAGKHRGKNLTRTPLIGLYLEPSINDLSSSSDRILPLALCAML